jgi:hypothetical protein
MMTTEQVHKEYLKQLLIDYGWVAGKGGNYSFFKDAKQINLYPDGANAMLLYDNRELVASLSQAEVDNNKLLKYFIQ